MLKKEIIVVVVCKDGSENRGLEEAGPSRIDTMGESKGHLSPLGGAVKSRGWSTWETGFYWKATENLVACFTSVSSLYSVSRHVISKITVLVTLVG